MKNQKPAITERIFIRTEWRLLSALSIGSGEGEATDHDILRNADGKPYVPATSIAGLLHRTIGDKDIARRILGIADQSADWDTSRVTISDGAFLGSASTATRDGVKLQERLACKGGKYNLEAVEKGAVFAVRMELDILQGEATEDYLHPLLCALYRINLGDARLGYKANRGLGRVHISGDIKRFQGSELMDSLGFRWAGHVEDTVCLDAAFSERFTTQTNLSEENRKGREVIISNWQWIQAKLTLNGTLCIRQYATTLTGAEYGYQQLLANGKAVIPGSSWAGALRDHAWKILRLLGLEELQAEQATRQLFGYLEEPNRDTPPKTNSVNTHVAGEKPKKKPQLVFPSNCVFEESEIEGGTFTDLTRTKVDRFTGGIARGCLYTERVQVGGETEIRMGIKRDVSLPWAAELLLLTLEDMRNGMLPIGGEVGVGRGIFSVDEITWDGTQLAEPVSAYCNQYQALAEYVHETLAQAKLPPVIEKEA